MEQGKIKGNKSKYYKKSENKEIETISKYINLGVKSNFKVGSKIFVLSESEYKDLTNNINLDAINELNTLKETIKDLKKQINKLSDENNTINKVNETLLNKTSEYESKIKEQNNIILDNEKELSKYNFINIPELQEKIKILESSNKEQLKSIDTMNKYIIYLEQLQTDYKELLNYQRNKNLLTPLLNKIGLSDIVKPQLKHLDMHGHKLNESKNPILTDVNTNNNKSE